MRLLHTTAAVIAPKSTYPIARAGSKSFSDEDGRQSVGKEPRKRNDIGTRLRAASRAARFLANTPTPMPTPIPIKGVKIYLSKTEAAPTPKVNSPNNRSNPRAVPASQVRICRAIGVTPSLAAQTSLAGPHNFLTVFRSILFSYPRPWKMALMKIPGVWT
jgi:hypothetical protein